MTAPVVDLAEWAKPVPWTRRDKISGAVTVIMLPIMAAMSLVTITIASPLAAIFPAGTAAMLAGAVLFVATHRDHTGSRAGLGSAAHGLTVIRQPLSRLLCTAAGYGAYATGAIATVALFAALPLSHRMQVVVLPVATFIVAVSFSLEWACQRIHRASISLSDKGITQRGLAWEQFTPWSSVRTVQPEFITETRTVHRGTGRAPLEIIDRISAVMVLATGDCLPGDRRRTAWLWRMDKPPREYRHSMRIDCRDFATDPLVILGILGYYAANPHARSELGTQAALDRALGMLPPSV